MKAGGEQAGLGKADGPVTAEDHGGAAGAVEEFGQVGLGHVVGFHQVFEKMQRCSVIGERVEGVGAGFKFLDQDREGIEVGGFVGVEIVAADQVLQDSGGQIVLFFRADLPEGEALEEFGESVTEFVAAVGLCGEGGHKFAFTLY